MSLIALVKIKLKFDELFWQNGIRIERNWLYRTEKKDENAIYGEQNITGK